MSESVHLRRVVQTDCFTCFTVFRARFVVASLLLLETVSAWWSSSSVRPNLDGYFRQIRISPRYPDQLMTLIVQASAVPRTITVRAISSSPDVSSSSDSLRQVQEHSVLLSSGISMQVLTQRRHDDLPQDTQQQQRKPILLFLHGSFHGAWCWAEHWFDYFACQNYPVAALSWRGTGGSPAGNGVKKVPIRDHVQDLYELLTQHLFHLVSTAGSTSATAYDVVLISHSFGGLVIMKLLEAHPDLLQSSPTRSLSSDSDTQTMPPPIHLKGIVTCCSVPPSGNGPMTMRYLKRSLKASWKITSGLAMKKVLTNADLCRELFFTTDRAQNNDGDDISDDDLFRYQQYFARDSAATIDLLDLAKQLPSALTDESGRAPFVDLLPPCLVLGAKYDYIVDSLGAQETAQYYGLDEPVYVNSPHDVMLSRHWMQGANALAQWMDTNVG